MGCPFAFDDAVMENDNAENRENSHPNISKVDDTIRKRNRGLRGKAFRFSGTFTGFKFFSQHDRINEFNKRVGDRILATKQDHVTLDSISYVVLSYEIARLLPTEICDVPVIGYIQSTKQVFAKTLQKWMGNELEWLLVPGGLCGSPEFTREIQNSGEGRALHTVYGQLGMNNCGSKKVMYFLVLTSAIGTATLNASHFLYQAADERREEDLRTRSESGSVRPKRQKSNSSDCSFSSQSTSASCSSPHSGAEPPPSSFSEPVAPRTPSSSLPAKGCGSGGGNRSSQSNSASSSSPHSGAEPPPTSFSEPVARQLAPRTPSSSLSSSSHSGAKQPPMLWVGPKNSAGERHGMGVLNGGAGNSNAGRYVDGFKQGRWGLKLQSGARLEGCFADGKKHGPWVEHLANGDRSSGAFAKGFKTGPWSMIKPNDTRWEAMFQDGSLIQDWKVRVTGCH
jgi:hypothetical protein